MRRQKMKPMHYSAICLYDGTIAAANPTRKPTLKMIKRDNLRIDEDGVCDRGWYYAGKEFSDVHNENRFRFMDIISNRLNTRRAIREILIPHIQKLENEVEALHQKLDQIQQLFTNHDVVKP